MIFFVRNHGYWGVLTRRYANGIRVSSLSACGVRFSFARLGNFGEVRFKFGHVRFLGSAT